MLKEVDATCITLVPKIDNHMSLGEYRPTACCNVVYNCITKILTRFCRLSSRKVYTGQHSLIT